MKIINSNQAEKFVKLATSKTADYIRDHNLKSIAVGISGGIDSAVVAVIGLKIAAKLRTVNHNISTHYWFLDCESDEYDQQRAEALAAQFDFKLNHLDLTQWYQDSPLHQWIPNNHQDKKIAQGNIKARLRMIVLYQSAKLHQGVYLDSDDLSEGLLGFWTRHGDEGDLNFTQAVTKTEMYDLGEYLGVPQIILDSQPSDGLGVTPGNLAKDQLGLEYIEAEYILSRFIGEGLNTEGDFDQLKQPKFLSLIDKIAEEISRSTEDIKKIITQCLKTAYKRYHDTSINLLTKRSEFGFAKLGSDKFNQIYLQAIKP